MVAEVAVAGAALLEYLAEEKKAGCVGCPPGTRGTRPCVLTLAECVHTCGRGAEAARREPR